MVSAKAILMGSSKVTIKGSLQGFSEMLSVCRSEAAAMHLASNLKNLTKNVEGNLWSISTKRTLSAWFLIALVVVA